MFAAHHEKIFVPAFLRSLMITYLITSSLEKEIIVLGRSLEKVVDFGSRNLYKPSISEVKTESNVLVTHLF